MKVWVILGILALTQATVYFKEEFNPGWESNWVESTWRTENGSKANFKHSHGAWFVDAEADMGIQTPDDYRFYAISAKFPPQTNKDKDLVVQFSVKFEQFIDCGGGYIKILKDNFDQSTYGGDTPYHIMFGPDICGGERKTHLILGHDGKNFESNKKFRTDTDVYTHLYTAWIKKDNTYQIFIDNIEISKGKIEEHWDMLPAKEIKDPDAKKPDDWVDEPTIIDPEDKKPEGWDDIPENIPDPDAKQPEDWSEEDGEWKPPLKKNPDFKGEWKPKRIPNPDYKGEWKHPKIANPEYKEDNTLYLYENIAGIGIEIWQVKSGTIFDNIWIGDDYEEAKAFAAKTWQPRKDGEKAAKEAYDEKNKPPPPPPKEEAEEETEDDFEDVKKEDL